MSINKSMLDLAKKSFDRGETQKALELCISHLESHPDDKVALRLNANLLGIEGRIDEAIHTITRVITHGTPSEPCDFFYRGRWRLKAGDLPLAVADLRSVLAISTEANDDYYTEAANLHLAYAFAVMHDRKSAEECLAQIGDECTTSIGDSIITKRVIHDLLQR